MNRVFQMATKLETPVPEEARVPLVEFAALVAHWNKRIHLVSAQDVARLVTRHVLESLALLACLPETSSIRLMDLGTGAGFPSIPLNFVPLKRLIPRPTYFLLR